MVKPVKHKTPFLLVLVLYTFIVRVQSNDESDNYICYYYLKKTALPITLQIRKCNVLIRSLLKKSNCDGNDVIQVNALLIPNPGLPERQM